MPYSIDGAGSVQEYVSVRVKVNFTPGRGPCAG